ncbi:unnamed protein product, partial [Acidithrix sp. C25]
VTQASQDGSYDSLGDDKSPKWRERQEKRALSRNDVDTDGYDADLPHWTEAPTGEIPIQFAIDRTEVIDVDLDSVDEGAFRWVKNRRHLDADDEFEATKEALFSAQSEVAVGRHFASSGDLIEEDVIDLEGFDDYPIGKHARRISTTPVRTVSSSTRSTRRTKVSPLVGDNAASTPQPKHRHMRTSNKEVSRDLKGDAADLPPAGFDAPLVEDSSSFVSRLGRRDKTKTKPMRAPSENNAPAEGPSRSIKDDQTMARNKRGERRVDPPASSSNPAGEVLYSLKGDTNDTLGARAKKSSVFLRIATGAALGALAVVCFLVGQWAVLVILTIAVVIAMSEFYNMLVTDHPNAPVGGYKPAKLIGILGGVALIYGAYYQGAAAIAYVLSISLVACFVWYLAGILKGPILPNASVTFLGIAWIGLGGAFIALVMRPIPGDPRRGLAYMMAILLVTVSADVFAYFGGLALGRRKLAPTISPGKTIEGFLFGALGSVLVGALITSHIHPVTPLLGGTIGLITAFAAPVGDLVESKIKREIGAKDAGSILPGHGGILDRIDALIFVTPILYYVLYFSHHL